MLQRSLSSYSLPPGATARRSDRFAPSFGIRHTAYGQRREQGSLRGMNFYRNSREFSLDIAPPSSQRIFEGPKWLGDRVKHVIKPRIRYRFVDDIDNFDKVIRFDGRDLLTNTNEADISVMNRLYAKDAATGGVREVASLEIWQRRYFDPEFGGALVPVSRNVFSSTVDVTPFAFIDQARNACRSCLRFASVRTGARSWAGARTTTRCAAPAQYTVVVNAGGRSVRRKIAARNRCQGPLY